MDARFVINMKMRFFILTFLTCCFHTAKSQFITARATHATGIVSNNLFKSDLSKSIGAEIYFSKPFAKIPFNYNFGIDYQNTDGIHSAYAITGITFVIFTPSGFSATNAESVSYTTSNWLNYADMNLYNGVQINDSLTNYALGVELGYNIGYVFGKYFFIHTGLGGRYNYIPANKETMYEHNSIDFMLKIGVLWKIRKKYK